jgi:hypothetical protein
MGPACSEPTRFCHSVSAYMRRFTLIDLFGKSVLEVSLGFALTP